jgi:hypothetical protein
VEQGLFYTMRKSCKTILVTSYSTERAVAVGLFLAYRSRCPTKACAGRKLFSSSLCWYAMLRDPAGVPGEYSRGIEYVVDWRLGWRSAIVMVNESARYLAVLALRGRADSAIKPNPSRSRQQVLRVYLKANLQLTGGRDCRKGTCPDGRVRRPGSQLSEPERLSGWDAKGEVEAKA